MAEKIELASPPASFKSKIWTHFGFKKVEKDSVKSAVKDVTTCRHYFKDVSYKGGNTSNMAAHMKRHHAEKYDTSECSRPSKKVKKEDSTETKGPSISGTGQLRLHDVVHKKFPFSSSRAVAITKAIGKFIAVDMRPFSVVETPGFKNMINILEPKYDVPTRVHFSQKVVPELYKETVSKVKTDLKNAESISLTTDGWTSKATQSYNTVTSHFIDQNWQLKSYVLQTRPLFESHTAQNLADVLQESVKEWNLSRTIKINTGTEEVLQSKPIAITTDNAANIVKGVELAGFQPHIRCFAHCLNLAVQKAMQINSVSRLLGRMRRVVTFFHSSSTATKVLRDKQKALSLPAHRLVQDIKTRWNSSYDMVSSYLEQQPAIYATLMNKDIKKNLKDVVTLSDTDLSEAEELVEVLKLFKTVTTVMCEEKSPTISMIHPMKEKLLRHLTERETDSGLVKQVKSAIRVDIESRYTDPNIIKVLEISCALDPRFKSLPYHDQNAAGQVYNSIIDLMVGTEKEVRVKTEPSQSEPSGSLPALPQLPGDPEPIHVETADVSSTESLPEPDDSYPREVKPKSAMQDLFGDILVVKVVPAKPVYTRAVEEIQHYRSVPGIKLEENPLTWWRQHQESFPLLAKLAKSYLAIQGTSVPSERVFSTAGDIVSAQRAALSPENVDMLIFLKKNLEV